MAAKALPVVLLLSFSCLRIPAQDTVTVPKSRLEELERKEAELQRIKEAGSNAPAQAVPSASGVAPAAMPTPSLPTAAPTAVRVSPPVASLPPLKDGEIVDAADLSNQYLADRNGADARYHGGKITLRGEIVAFEKPILRKNYKILLQGGDRASRVICDFVPPEKFSAILTTNDGAQLVGQFGENRQPLAKVGQSILVHGKCRGLKGSAVIITVDDFSSAP